MIEINKNDAPDGYIAVEFTSGCNGCAFRIYNSCGPERNCEGNEREDGKDVVFVKDEE